MSRVAGPIGYFVHHQGRGHAERATALASAFTGDREVMLFCARDDIFPPLPPGVRLTKIPSLFERSEEAAQEWPRNLDEAVTPETLHCAPLGWDGITRATAAITGWFADAAPALFITDVSAELGQLARIASVPHLAVLQHGNRDDSGHMASYAGSVGLLAPYAESLEQPERPRWMREKTIYAPGIGIDASRLGEKGSARIRLGLAADADIVVVLGGGGGTGLPSAPLTLGARAEPHSSWITLGKIQSEWHETPPANLTHLGWVNNPEDWISAADRIVSSCGNTTVHMIAAVGKPWIVVPEWRYFSEQLRKAEALDRAGVAATARHWPGSRVEWQRLWQAAIGIDPQEQRALVSPSAAADAARDIEALIEHIWAKPAASPIRQIAATS